jgi:hypothetical protein
MSLEEGLAGDRECYDSTKAQPSLGGGSRRAAPGTAPLMLVLEMLYYSCLGEADIRVCIGAKLVAETVLLETKKGVGLRFEAHRHLLDPGRRVGRVGKASVLDYLDLGCG